MPEADDDRLAEVPDAVGIRAQVAVVAARGDLRDRGVGGIPLQDRDRAVRVTVSANEVWNGSPQPL